MPRFSLATIPPQLLLLLLLILLPCRLCAARNDPGGRRHAAGVQLPTWKLCLLVALPVATAALLAALIVLACRRRNQNASVAVAPPAAQNREKKQVDKPNQWSARLWSSMSPRNPMSINPTMVRSPYMPSPSPSPSPHQDTEPDPLPRSSHYMIFAGLAASSLSRSRRPPPAKVAPPLRPGPSAAQAASPVRPGQPAQVRANLQQPTLIHDPLACYSPAFWVRLTHLDYDQLQSGTNEFKSKSLPDGHVVLGPWNVVLKDTQIVEDKGLPVQVTIKRHHGTFTEKECKRIRKELKRMCTLRHKNLVKLHVPHI